MIIAIACPLIGGQLGSMVAKSKYPVTPYLENLPGQEFVSQYEELKKLRNNDIAYWYFGGSVIGIISAIGIYTVRKKKRDESLEVD